MSAASDVLDTLLHLGRRIADALEAEDWSRVARLVEQRGQVATQLGEREDRAVEDDLSQTEKKEKVEALADQNQHLMELLRERRDEIEEELAQIGQLKHAQDSYEANSSHDGVLPSELKG